MAAVSFLVATPLTTDQSSYNSGAFSPAVGDLLVVAVVASANVLTPTCTAATNGISTFTNVVQIIEDASSDRAAIFVADQLSTGTTSMTVTVATGAATGAIVSVCAVSGMRKRGATAVRQTNGVDNSFLLGGTPALTFGLAPLTTNPVIAFCANNSTPAAVTPPAGFAERGDVGYAIPNTGLEGVSVDSASPTTLTWGSTSATRGGVLAIELDANPDIYLTMAPRN